MLREVRDANPPTRFLTTHAQVEKRFVIGVDPEEEPSEKSHLGDEIFADDELPQVLKGERPDVNAVFADEFGVWITGLAPIRDASGHIVAAVAADLPALSLSESETLRGDGRQTFAAMLQTAAVRLSRAEIDAITDALTGLYNHRYLHERLSEELHRARDLQRPLSVLFCDLDHFKGYNDTNGHSAGDAVLREVAHVIEQSVRNIDIAARYGGEEFVVLLVETERETALGVAERIRERIRAAGFTANDVPLTVSIGVAGYPDDADRREDLLNKADWAMYLAKRRGRDQVASFGEGVSRGGRRGRRRSRPGPGASGPAAAGDADVAAPQGQALPVEVLEEGLRVAASAPGGVAEPGQRHLARALELRQQHLPGGVHRRAREPEVLVHAHDLAAAREHVEDLAELARRPAQLLRQRGQRRRGEGLRAEARRDRARPAPPARRRARRRRRGRSRLRRRPARRPPPCPAAAGRRRRPAAPARAPRARPAR